jgi:hypothetical protein
MLQDGLPPFWVIGLQPINPPFWMIPPRHWIRADRLEYLIALSPQSAYAGIDQRCLTPCPLASLGRLNQLIHQGVDGVALNVVGQNKCDARAQ